MYHTIVKRKLQTAFADINSGNHTAIVDQFTPDAQHWFAGDHALSGRRRGRELIRAWYERLALLLPDLTFALTDVVVRGWPWNTTAVVLWTDKVHDRKGVQHSNQGVHVIGLRWGKISSLEIHCDTSVVTVLLDVLRDQGVEQAGAAPITAESWSYR